MDILDEIEGKAIIWAHWQRDVTNKRALEKNMSRIRGDYYGLTPQDERQKNKDKFQKNSKCRFCRHATDGWLWYYTYTANTVIYYSNGYDLEKKCNQKTEHTEWTKSVTYIDIIADDTVDTKIVNFRKKINIASQVMGEELKQWI